MFSGSSLTMRATLPTVVDSLAPNAKEIFDRNRGRPACARRRSRQRTPRPSKTPAPVPASGELLCPDLRVGRAADLYVERRGAAATATVAARFSTPATTSAPAGAGRWSCAASATSATGCRPTRRSTGSAAASALPHRRQAPLLQRRLRVGRLLLEGRRTRSAWRSGRSTRTAAAAAGAQGPEGLLLLPRPGAHPGDEALAQPPRLPRLQPGPAAASGSGSAPRSAGRTSTPPTTTASGSTSAACAAASPSSCGSTPQNLLYEEHESNNRSVRIIRLPYRDGPQHC